MQNRLVSQNVTQKKLCDGWARGMAMVMGAKRSVLGNGREERLNTKHIKSELSGFS